MARACLTRAALLAAALVLPALPAGAEYPVIDATAIEKATQQLNKLQQQLDVLNETRDKIQAQINAIGKMGQITQDLATTLLPGMWALFGAIVGIWVILHGYMFIVASPKADLGRFVGELIPVMIAAMLLHGQGPTLVNNVYFAALNTMGSAAGLALSVGGEVPLGECTSCAVDNTGLTSLVATAEVGIVKVFKIGEAIIAAAGGIAERVVAVVYALLLVLPYAVGRVHPERVGRPEAEPGSPVQRSRPASEAGAGHGETPPEAAAQPHPLQAPADSAPSGRAAALAALPQGKSAARASPLRLPVPLLQGLALNRRDLRSAGHRPSRPSTRHGPADAGDGSQGAGREEGTTKEHTGTY